MQVSSARHHLRIPLSGKSPSISISGGGGTSAASDINGDADRQSARFFGIHKVVRPDQWKRRGRGYQLSECFVLLPGEGVVNIPFDEADDAEAALARIGRQLELQTGFAMSACCLVAGEGVQRRGGGGGVFHGATLSLRLRPAYQQLLTDVQTNSCSAVRAWLTAAARAAPGGGGGGGGGAELAADGRLRLRPVAHAGLLLACCLSNLTLVRLFLQSMPELANSVTGGTSRTCLHFACYHELAAVCRLLVSRMCRQAAGLADCNGLRAADYASPGSPSRILALKAAAAPSTARQQRQLLDNGLPGKFCHGNTNSCRGDERCCHGNSCQPSNRIRLFDFPMPDHRSGGCSGCCQHQHQQQLHQSSFPLLGLRSRTEAGL